MKTLLGKEVNNVFEFDNCILYTFEFDKRLEYDFFITRLIEENKNNLNDIYYSLGFIDFTIPNKYNVRTGIEPISNNFIVRVYVNK